MKRYIIILILLSFSIFAKEEVDTETSASVQICKDEVCDDDKMCVNDKCEFKCSKEHPKGVCHNGEICFSGKCKKL